MSFIDLLIEWYEVKKRDLPWRKTDDPYVIWLSEIILQQTRVEQGLPYFIRFSQKYPRVADFAAASEDEILTLWQGLGYYSRGRNMLKTARQVVEEYGAAFPRSYDQLIKLKGIGEYTAAAISSFSANEARAVLDGNVYRVLSRYFGIQDPINSAKAKPQFTKLANSLIDSKRAGLSNQAMMEFGALHCKPKKPLCGSCPLQNTCVALRENRVEQLPVKIKKAPVRNRFFNYIVVRDANQILMTKRGPNDIWQNLYEFPLFETPHFVEAHSLIESDEFREQFGKLQLIEVYGPVKHVLSHQKIHAQFLIVADQGFVIDPKKNWVFTDVSHLKYMAQPQLIFAFLKKILP